MISVDFLKAETRDGYYISEMMKRSWAAQLSILESLKKLFDKYDLQYFADYGSLLGAARHGGYIPWDDDLDISMPRKDFMTLLEHADEIDDGLLIRTLYNSETYMNFSAVVTHKADTLEWDEERTDRYHGCPFICYLDIFIWDYVPRDEEACKIQRKMYSLAYKLIYDQKKIETDMFRGKTVSLNDLKGIGFAGKEIINEFLGNYRSLKGLLSQHLKDKVSFDPDRKLRQQLCIAADTIAQMCSVEDADYVEYFPFLGRNAAHKPRRKKEWQETTVELPFEAGTIMVPKDYEEILNSIYGKDYAVPIRYSSDHDYPFFRDEIRVLINGDTGDILPDEPTTDPYVEAIPEEIRQYLMNEDGSLKSIILYGLSATDIINNGEKSLNNIRSYLSRKATESGVVVFVFVPHALKTFMDKCHLEMYQDYCNMIDQIGEMDNVILDENPDVDMLWALISICDVYYGDKCRLSEICIKYDVPVILQEYQPV